MSTYYCYYVCRVAGEAERYTAQCDAPVVGTYIVVYIYDSTITTSLTICELDTQLLTGTLCTVRQSLFFTFAP